MVRPPTPQPIARQLRQEAGFGCCVCGLPILQYHHIVEWTDEHHFRAADMMALCPNHHDQATKRAMPEREQREFKSNPYNIVHGRANGVMEVRQEYCAADFGSVTVVGDGTFLRIGGEEIIGFRLENGKLEFSLRLYGESDDLLLHINRNEWVSGDSLPWDIEADWQMLTLRERARQIAISINAKSVPLQVTGEFYRLGKRVVINRNGIQVGGRSGCGISEVALVGASLEIDLDQTGFFLRSHPTNQNAYLISYPNRRERLWKAKEVWKKIEAKRSEI